MFDNDLFGAPVENNHGSILAKSFDYPPFSVLSARDGWWQERKRQWLALGIKSEVGRGGGCNDMSPQIRALKPSAMMDQSEESRRRGGLDIGQLAAGDAKGVKLLSGKAAPGGSARPACNYGESRARGDGRGRAI
jgi:hypothetical protein